MAKSLLRTFWSPAAVKQESWRRYPEFDNHEFIMALNDDASGLRAYIGIHNTNLGPALGGTRMQLYATEEAGVRDVLNLSKAMSYKCALARLPYGGGKAVILADPAGHRTAVLSAYARLVEKLGGLFKTGTDVGITEDDVALMAQQTTHMLGVTSADRENLTTGKTAALGVFYAMKAALTKLYGKSDFAGKTIAIKGVGKLGSELARLTSEAGAEVAISDINAQACDMLKQQLPALQIVSNTDIHKLSADIFAPCALGNEFTAKTVNDLYCKAIVGGANNQLANPVIGDIISGKGILYAPDYIANAGGLIYVADELEAGGFNAQRVRERVSGIEQTMLEIFETAEHENLPTHLVADRIAQARIMGGIDAK